MTEDDKLLKYLHFVSSQSSLGAEDAKRLTTIIRKLWESNNYYSHEDEWITLESLAPKNSMYFNDWGDRAHQAREEVMSMITENKDISEECVEKEEK